MSSLKLRRFNPKPDITAYELAKILAQFCLLLEHQPSEDSIEVPEAYVTDEISRHFD